MTLTVSSLSSPPSHAAGSGGLAASFLPLTSSSSQLHANSAIKSPLAASSIWSYADAKTSLLPSVVSSGLLPSASLSSSPHVVSSISSIGSTNIGSSISSVTGIAHIPLSLARRHLGSVSSDAVSYRVRQQALVSQLTGAFVSWQQQAVDEYSQILQRCKRDANDTISQLNAHNAALTRAAKEAEAAREAMHDATNRQLSTNGSGNAMEGDRSAGDSVKERQQHNEHRRSSTASASAVNRSSLIDTTVLASNSAIVTEPQRPLSAPLHAEGVPAAEEATAEAAATAEYTSAIERQEAASHAVQQLATAIGLPHTLPSDCQAAVQSLHSALLPWLAERSTLAARVQSIKQTQTALQAEKARLTAWKDAIKHKQQQQQQQQQQQGDDSRGNSAEQLAAESRQWDAAKQQLATDGVRLKDEHAEYEKRIAQYKAEEVNIKQRWADIQQQASGDEPTREAAPLPSADKLSALIDGWGRLIRAHGQVDLIRSQSAASRQQTTPLQQQEHNTPTEAYKPQPAPAAAVGEEHKPNERSNTTEPVSSPPFNAVAALSAATRRIAEQQSELTELTQQLAAVRQAEKDNNAHSPPHTSHALTPRSGEKGSTVVSTGAAEAEETVRLPQSSSSLPSTVPSSSPSLSPSSPPASCSSCDALLARCSSLDASLSASAAQLSAANARLSSELERHAAVESEWRQQQQSALGSSEAEVARYGREASERQLQLEDLSRLLDDTVKKGNRELNESRASQQRQMEEAVSALERQQANERQQWAQQLEASTAAASSQSAVRAALEQQLAEEQRRWRETDAQLTEQRAAFEALRAEAAEALQARDGLLAQLAAASADIERLHALLEAERQRADAAEAGRVEAFESMLEEQKRRKEFQFKYEDAKGKVRVYARVRPFTAAEVAAKERTLLRPGRNAWTLELNETQRDVLGHISDKWREFAFDHVFHAGLGQATKANGSQAEVFNETAAFAELSLQGINCCVFAYGQSGTGKTWTMAGLAPSSDNGHSRELLGLKPRMIERVYELAAEMAPSYDVVLSCYMVEIYLNALEDLFWKQDTAAAMRGKEGKWPEAPELKVRADGAKKKVQVDNVRIKTFTSAADMQAYCDAAEKLRRVRKTGLNEASSRSHLVFAIMSECTNRQTGKTVKGKLSLVDLAGSERADKTNVDGLSKASRDCMLEEGVAINESLRMLKNVFRILGSAHLPLAKGAKAEIVQYRGNMLTELMQDSLGGNAKTLMFVNVGPAASNISESIDSLQYGDCVKNITNDKATADEDYTEQIRRLKETLQLYKDKYGEITS